MICNITKDTKMTGCNPFNHALKPQVTTHITRKKMKVKNVPRTVGKTCRMTPVTKL